MIYGAFVFFSIFKTIVYENTHLSYFHQRLIHIHTAVAVLQVSFCQLVLFNELCVEVPAKKEE